MFFLHFCSVLLFFSLRGYCLLFVCSWHSFFHVLYLIPFVLLLLVCVFLLMVVKLVVVPLLYLNLLLSALKSHHSPQKWMKTNSNAIKVQIITCRWKKKYEKHKATEETDGKTAHVQIIIILSNKRWNERKRDRERT